MRRLWRRLALALCVMFIMGTITVPVSAAEAADKKVTGGGSRSTATIVKTNVSYYTTIKSSQACTAFKFKTNSIRSCYRVSVYNKSVSKPVSAYLRGTDKKDAGAASNNRNMPKEHGGCFDAEYKPLKENSWYYIIFKNPNKGAGQVTFHIFSATDPEGSLMREAKKLEVGKTYYGTNDYLLDFDYFKFVPEKTGKYRVVIKNINNTYRIRGYVMDGSRNKLGGSSKIREGQYASVKLNMKKGTTYYICIDNQNDDNKHYDYKIFIQKR